MDYPPIVHVVQCGENVFHDGGGLLVGERSRVCFSLGHQLFETAALHELGDNQKFGIRLDDVDEFYDVGVVELPEDLGFTLNVGLFGYFDFFLRNYLRFEGLRRKLL
jgi:hypothetical protein